MTGPGPDTGLNESYFNAMVGDLAISCRRAFRYNFVIQECAMLKFGDLLFLIASQVSSQRC
jgi:hypothetical protein